MDEFWHAFGTAIIVVCMGSLCATIGYSLRTIQAMLTTQQLILDQLLPLYQGICNGSVTHQMMATNNWRDLPADQRLALRNALVEVLAEMNAELQTRH